MLPEPRRASALVQYQVSRVFRLVLQRVHRHVWVVWHLRSHQQGGAAGESTGPRLAFPHLHYHALGPELRLFRRSGALVVRGHQLVLRLVLSCVWQWSVFWTLSFVRSGLGVRRRGVVLVVRFLAWPL